MHNGVRDNDALEAGKGAPRFGLHTHSPHFEDHDFEDPGWRMLQCVQAALPGQGGAGGYVTSSAEVRRGGRPERARGPTRPDPGEELVVRLRGDRRRLTGP